MEDPARAADPRSHDEVVSSASGACNLGVIGAASLALGNGGEEAPDALGDPRRPFRGPQVEGMLGSGQLDVADVLVRDLAKPLGEEARVLYGDQGVLLAVDDEERRRIRVNPEEGAR